MKYRRTIDYRALADFRYEIRRFLNFSESAARAAGMEPHQHQALLAIRGQRKGALVTVGVLAERLQIQHHSAVELSCRLRNKKLIYRSRGHQDRREVVLRLTPRAEHLLLGLSLTHSKELELAGPRLIEALRRVLSARCSEGTTKATKSTSIKESKSKGI